MLLGLTGFVVLALLGGSAWSITGMLATQPNSHRIGGGVAATGAGNATGKQDDWATGSLPDAGLRAAQPGPLSTGSSGTISLPQPDRLGAAQVPTGFPHTSQGALAQLISIDQRALESTSLITAQDVIASWARAGGPTPQDWSVVGAVATLLSAAGSPAEGTPDLEVGLHPAMGLIRGGDAEDLGVSVVVPCVDFVATIRTDSASPSGVAGPTVSSPVRVAVADCQRMVWAGGRWMIASGAEPPSSPSIWPGTQASYDAGYQWLTVSP